MGGRTEESCGGRPLFFGGSATTAVGQGGSNEKASCILHAKAVFRILAFSSPQKLTL